MRVYKEITTAEELRHYLERNSWSGAKDRVEALNWKELTDKCQKLLDLFDYETISETQLNDEVWFGEIFNDDDDEYEDEDEDEDEE